MRRSLISLLVVAGIVALLGACAKEKPAPPPPPPPPPPAAAPPAPTRQFNVYFDFDKANLTPEGQRIVELVATQVKSDNSTVVLVGKADLSGTDSYNLALSKHRADAVHSALAAAGVPGDHIEERYVGMREPPVPTAPGVREPRNRVVEISFH